MKWHKLIQGLVLLLEGVALGLLMEYLRPGTTLKLLELLTPETIRMVAL